VKTSSGCPFLEFDIRYALRPCHDFRVFVDVLKPALVTVEMTVRRNFWSHSITLKLTNFLLRGQVGWRFRNIRIVR
jgi:hypothetical protein